MSLTLSQTRYAEFLLKRIGFNESNGLQEYLKHLMYFHGKWISVLRNDKTTSKFTSADCITHLKEEVDLKINKYKKIKYKVESGNLSATDFSNFVFCKVAFAINRTFRIEELSNQIQIEIGSKLHEQLRLINRTSPYFYDTVEVESNEIIKIIRQSELIFAGHDTNNTLFYNELNHVVGQPDYIFRDKNLAYFIVEEKFRENHDDESVKEIFPNHVIQLLSYLINIKQYEIKFGYLIQWGYGYLRSSGSEDYGMPRIESVKIKKIELNDKSIAYFEEILNEIKTFQKTGTTSFNQDKINLRKCAGCSVNKYCTHKTGIHQTIDYPFNMVQMNLFSAKFIHKNGPNNFNI